MYEERLVLFEGDHLTQRFASRGARTLVPLEQLLERVRGIDVTRCQRVVLAGSDPMEHPDFWRLVEALHSVGCNHLGLDTTAAAIAPDGVLERLVTEGFEVVFPVIGAMRRRVYERVMRADELDAALAGIRRLAATSLHSYVVFPLLSGNERDAEALLDWLVAMPARVTGLLLFIPDLSSIAQLARRHVLDHVDAAPLIARLFARAHDARLEYGFYDKRGLLPCAAGRDFDRFGTVFHDRLRWLRHAKGERLTRIAACAACSLDASCPGIEQAYVDTFGSERLAAVHLDVSMSWKLRKLNQLEQRDYKNVSAFKSEVAVEPRGLVRVNGHCNMSCSFCFVDRTVPDFDADQLKRDLDGLAIGGTRHLVLSGGEPTLHPDLTELIGYARKLSFATIELQTNGVRCANLSYTEQLVAAGLSKVTISLHSTDPVRSDQLTRLPKAFGKTIQALHNFRALGVETQVAHVITKSNYEGLPEFFEFLAREFPSAAVRLSVCLAIAQGISDLVYTWVIPRFSEIRPFVRAALDIALAHGIGFGGMIGQGGYPPCMLDGELKYYANTLDQIYRSIDYAEQFYKARRCETCSFDPYCLGIRRAYVEVYGDDELQPFQARLAPGSQRVPVAVSSAPALVQLGSQRTAIGKTR